MSNKSKARQKEIRQRRSLKQASDYSIFFEGRKPFVSKPSFTKHGASDKDEEAMK